MSDTGLEKSPFHFKNGVIGLSVGGGYVIECPTCGWGRTQASRWQAVQDARAHLCPRAAS